MFPFCTLVGLLLCATPQSVPASAPLPDPPSQAHTQAALVPPAVITEATATYPQAAKKKGLQAVVRLKVTIDSSGRVVDVVVLEPVGNGFDEAAIAALKQYRFSPAKLEDKPVPVEIEYAYHFVLRPAQPAGATAAADALHTIRGRVLQKGSKVPLPSAEVYLKQLDRVVETDAAGAFTLRVPVGRYHIKVDAIGHHSATTHVTVSGRHLTTMTIYLPTRADERYTTVVRERRDDRAEEPVIHLSKEEIRRVPGTFGDPVRVIQTLPGVARPRSVEGDIVVRGSEPGNTPLYLGGFTVPFLFHFGVLESVVDPAFVDRIDFFPGGIPLRYGNAAQGIVDVRTAEAKHERFFAEADLGATHSAGAATMPILDNKLRLDMGGRYSYLGLSYPALMLPLSLILSLGEVGVSMLPAFWDYNLRVSGGPPSARVYANLFGAHDGITIDVVLVEDVIGDFFGERGREIDDMPSHLTVYDDTFHHLVTGIDSRLPSGMEFSAAMLLGHRSRLDLFSLVGSITTGAFLRRDTNLMAARADWRVPASDFLALRVGGEAEIRDEHIYPTDELPLDEFLPTLREQPMGAGLFVAAEGKPWPGGRITAGARLQADRLHDKAFIRADPRLVLEQDAAYGVTARMIFARQSQLPDFVRSAQELGAEPLPLTISDQGIGGLRLDLPWELEAEISAYVSMMRGLSVQEEGWRAFRDPDTDETGVESFYRYIPAAGRAYGLEFSLRRRPKGKVYGWISYSISRALRTTRQHGAFVGAYDQPHHLIAVLACKLGLGFELSARFRLASGNPYTPFVGAFDADSREYQRVRGPRNHARDPLFHQLDVRLDKTFTFDQYKLGLYVDVYNAYFAQNPLPFSEVHLYSYDHFAVTGFGNMPVLPFFGLHLEY